MPVDALRAELSRAVKLLIRSPGYSLTVVLVLALGIGACGAMFSAIRSVLLEPLPYADSDRLVQVYNIYPKATSTVYGTLSIPDWLDRRERAPALEALMLYARTAVTLGAGQHARRVPAARVSASMFETLGVYPVCGSPFDESAMQPGAGRLVLLGHGLWRERYQSRTDVIGQSISIDGASYRIIGVMPEAFRFPDRDTRVWIPFEIAPAQRTDAERKDEFARAVGRLRPQATIAQLNQQFDAIAARNLERVSGPDGNAKLHSYLRSTGLTGRATDLREWRVRDLRARVLLLNAAVLVVFLIAVANVANLHLVRLLQRRDEWALRSALGAGRVRLLREQRIESVLLAGVALVPGAAAALAGVHFIRAVGIELHRPATELIFDPQIVGYMTAITLAAALIAAILPSRLIRAKEFSVMREAGRGIRGAGRGLARMQNALVTLQSGLAVLLLVGFGLVVQGFERLRTVDPGFNSGNVKYALLELPNHRYRQPADRIELLRQTKAGLAERGWRQPVGLISHLPLSGGDWNEPYEIRSPRQHSEDRPMDTHVRVADPNYLDVMGIGLLRGRWFRPTDDAGARPVVVIDRYMAETIFGNVDPVGQQIRLTGNRASDAGWREIVGVVDSVRHLGLSQPPTNETVYIPFRQHPLPFFNLVSVSETDSFQQALRETLEAVDPLLVETRRGSLAALVERALGTTRTPMQLLLIFGALALAMAALGLYSVVSFLVTSRTQELGVRRAMGAGNFRIASDVLGRGLRLVSTGAVLGTAAAALTAPWLSRHVAGVSAFDPGSYLLALLVLGAAGILACVLPAWRTVRIEPTEALQHE